MSLMKIAVVTDSTAYLSEAVRENKNLYIVPIPVIIDGQIYNEGIDIQIDDYFPLLNHSKEFPTTSQPAMGEMIELYQKLADDGYEAVISIHLSSGISGFVSNLIPIAQSMDRIRIYPFDSKITSLPMGYMVEAALQMIDEGKEVEEILERLDFLRDHMGAYMIVDDLNNLVRGGRLTNGAAIIGSLLKIKPVLTFSDGKIVVFEKIRSSKKAFKRVGELIGELIEEAPYELKIFVIHANDEKTAEKECKVLSKQYPNTDISIGSFGPVISTHLGEKALGFGWVPK